MSNLASRILIAVIGIPVFVGLGLTGGLAFLTLVILMASIALWELYRLFEAKGAHPLKPAGLVAGILVILTFYHPQMQTALAGFFVSLGGGLLFPSQHRLLMIVMILAAISIFLLELFRGRPSPLLNLAATMFGVLYVSLLMGTLVGLRELFNPFDIPVPRYFPDASSIADPDVVGALHTWGGATIVCVFASIWLCDSAAYAIGIPFGRHKLFPRVSPNKSWEGAIAGMIAAIAAMILAGVWFLPYLSTWDAVILGLIVGVVGQMGDLFESLLKRDAAVKDSSALIPGHGGVLDRFDSLLFVAPLVYLYIDFVVFS